MTSWNYKCDKVGEWAREYKVSEKSLNFEDPKPFAIGGFLADDLPDRGEAGRVLRVRGDGGAGQRHAGQSWAL